MFLKQEKTKSNSINVSHLQIRLMIIDEAADRISSRKAEKSQCLINDLIIRESWAGNAGSPWGERTVPWIIEDAKVK